MSFGLLVGALALTPATTVAATCDATPFTLHKPAPAVAPKPAPKPKPVAAAKPAPKPKPKAKIGCKSG
jgi:hypothetical protein